VLGWPQSHDRRVTHPVQAGVAGRQQSVHVVAGSEGIAWLVDPSLPRHCERLGSFTVEAFDAGTFAATQLLHRRRAHIFTGEAHAVHAAGHG